jgi:hypothetical protein
VFVITIDSGYQAASFTSKGVLLRIGLLEDPLILSECVLNLDTAPRSAVDVKEFVEREVKSRIQTKGVKIDNIDKVAQVLGAASGANYQIAKAILKRLDDPVRFLEVCRQLQERSICATSSAYLMLFEASFASFDAVERKAANMLLEILLATMRPMSQEELTAAVHPHVEMLLLETRRPVRQEEPASALHPQRLIETIFAELKVYMSVSKIDDSGQRGVERYALQHGVIREWLTDSLQDSRLVVCKLPRGHAILASFHLAMAQKMALLLLTAEFEAEEDRLAASRSIPFHVSEGAVHFALSSISDNSGKTFAALVASPILIAASPEGETAVHLAAKRTGREGHLALELLLEATENLQSCSALIRSSNKDATPLHLATAGGGPKAVEILLRAIDRAVEVQKTALRSDAVQVVHSVAGATDGAGECARLLSEWIRLPRAAT